MLGCSCCIRLYGPRQLYKFSMWASSKRQKGAVQQLGLRKEDKGNECIWRKEEAKKKIESTSTWSWNQGMDKFFKYSFFWKKDFQGMDQFFKYSFFLKKVFQILHAWHLSVPASKRCHLAASEPEPFIKAEQTDRYVCDVKISCHLKTMKPC